MQDIVHVRWINERILAKIALALTILARQNVAAIGLLALNRTRSGDLVSLLCTGVRLHLRHYYSSTDCCSSCGVDPSPASAGLGSFFFTGFLISGASMTPRNRPSIRIGWSIFATSARASMNR